MNDNNALYGIVLDHPDRDFPSYWIGKAAGEGPGWLISPSKVGRLKVPEHDAKRILERLPLVAQLKCEQGWKASVVKIGRKGRARRKTFTSENWPGEQVREEAPTPEPVQANTPLDLLKQIEVLRVQAGKLVEELDVDTPAGYWSGDAYSVLCRLENQGRQLLQGQDSPA
jgi:hypothetical protein